MIATHFGSLTCVYEHLGISEHFWRSLDFVSRSPRKAAQGNTVSRRNLTEPFRPPSLSYCWVRQWALWPPSLLERSTMNWFYVGVEPSKLWRRRQLVLTQTAPRRKPLSTSCKVRWTWEALKQLSVWSSYLTLGLPHSYGCPQGLLAKLPFELHGYCAADPESLHVIVRQLGAESKWTHSPW